MAQPTSIHHQPAISHQGYASIAIHKLVLTLATCVIESIIDVIKPELK
jgi:hypothetical protein